MSENDDPTVRLTGPTGMVLFAIPDLYEHGLRTHLQDQGLSLVPVSGGTIAMPDPVKVANLNEFVGRYAVDATTFGPARVIALGEVPRDGRWHPAAHLTGWQAALDPERAPVIDDVMLLAPALADGGRCACSHAADVHVGVPYLRAQEQALVAICPVLGCDCALRILR